MRFSFWRNDELEEGMNVGIGFGRMARFCFAHRTGLRLDYVWLQPCSSIPLRSIPFVYFRTRLDNTSPSAQCIAHGLRLDYVRLQPCSSIPLRSIPSVYFRTRLDNTSPSAQCIAHGLRLDYVRLQPCSSIPLRSISLTGCALCKKKEKVPHSCKHDVAPSFSFCAWLEPSLQICSNTLVRKGILRSGVR